VPADRHPLRSSPSSTNRVVVHQQAAEGYRPYDCRESEQLGHTRHAQAEAKAGRRKDEQQANRPQRTVERTQACKQEGGTEETGHRQTKSDQRRFGHWAFEAHVDDHTPGERCDL